MGCTQWGTAYVARQVLELAVGLETPIGDGVKFTAGRTRGEVFHHWVQFEVRERSIQRVCLPNETVVVVKISRFLACDRQRETSAGFKGFESEVGCFS